MKSPDLARIIGNIDDLPTLPRNIIRISELINNPKSSAKELARFITDDQVLTARLLRLVNSSFYGFPQKISTVTGAIVLLGFDAIRNLLLTTSIFDVFSKNKKDHAKKEQLWDHSLGCAIGAKVIGSFIRYDKIEELFVCGLLHDIGKIVEMLFLPKKFAEIMALVESKNMLMVTAEELILGYTHADIGKFLAERWNLPSNLISVIAHHHQPEQAGRFVQESAIIHVADIFWRSLETTSMGENKIPPLNMTAWETLQLSFHSIEPLMEEIARAFEDVSTAIITSH